MSEQQLKAFLGQIKVDAGLQEKLNGADGHAVSAIAQEVGLFVSVNRFKSAQASLSEVELESVAGGGCTSTAWPPSCCVRRENCKS